MSIDDVLPTAPTVFLLRVTLLNAQQFRRALDLDTPYPEQRLRVTT